MFVAFITGFVFGFAGSIPVAGPIAVLVMALGLEGRFRNGLMLAAGAAIAEAGYAFLAFIGFSLLLADRPWMLLTSKGLAAAILLGLGIYLLWPKKAAEKKEAKPESAKRRAQGDLRNFLLGFGISAMNPTIIVTWTAATAFLFSTELITLSTPNAIAFGIGCSFGIAGWFAVMLAGLQKFRQKISPDASGRVIRITGGLVLILGVYFAVNFIMLLL